MHSSKSTNKYPYLFEFPTFCKKNVVFIPIFQVKVIQGDINACSDLIASHCTIYVVHATMIKVYILAEYNICSSQTPLKIRIITYSIKLYVSTKTTVLVNP